MLMVNRDCDHFIIMLNNTQKKPAIFIFGWLGAKEYHMDRVKSFYEEIGIPAFSIIQSYKSILNISSNQQKINEFVNEAQDRPLIAHVFSLNGASAFLKCFTDETLKLKPAIQMKGLVLDSTPGHINRTLYHRAFSKALFPRSNILSSIANVVLAPGFDAFLLLARKHNKESERMIKHIYEHPFTCPQLIFSSEKDKLIRNQDVREYEMKAREAGAIVTSKYYTDSDHIKMYRDHRPEYKQLIQEFACKYLIESNEKITK